MRRRKIEIFLTLVILVFLLPQMELKAERNDKKYGKVVSESTVEDQIDHSNRNHSNRNHSNRNHSNRNHNDRDYNNQKEKSKEKSKKISKNDHKEKPDSTVKQEKKEKDESHRKKKPATTKKKTNEKIESVRTEQSSSKEEVEKTTQSSAEKEVEKTSESSTEKEVEKTSESSTEKEVEKTSESSTQNEVEKTAENHEEKEREKKKQNKLIGRKNQSRLSSPHIKVYYSGSHEKSCYSGPCTVKIILSARNIDSSSLKWQVEGEKEGYLVKPWIQRGGNYIGKIYFFGDGTFCPAFVAKDNSGMKIQWKGSQICIDQTPPELQMVLPFQESSKTEKIYLKDSPKVYVFVKDSNISKESIFLSSKDSLLNVQWMQEGEKSDIWKQYTKYLEGGWKAFSGKITKEGEYSLSCYCVDAAGNSSKKVLGREFVIDCTPPEIHLDGISNHAIFTDNASFQINVKDDYLDRKNCRAEICSVDGMTLYKIPEKTESVQKINQTENQMCFFWKDFPKKKEYDNHYILRLTMRDLAGNVAVKQSLLNFSVDRYGVRYVLDDEMKQYFKNYYQRKGKEISIISYSMYQPESQVTVTYNKKEFHILQSNDYKEETSVISDHNISDYNKEEMEYIPAAYNGWYRTVYRIPKELFSEEGDYEIAIRSCERNPEKMSHILSQSETILWMEPIRFAIDKTPPKETANTMTQKKSSFFSFIFDANRFF